MATLETFNEPFDVFIRTLPEPDPDIQVKRVHINSGVISRIDKLTYDTFRVVVKVSGDAPPINGTAGQYATIQVPGARRPRSYSFALDPEQENPDEHTFFIRLVHGGKLSSWLAEDDRTGEHVIISGPMGKFGIDDTNKTMVCIAGGSGMSAIHAIGQQACREQRERDCYFFYGARTQSDLYLVDELKEMERQWNSNFTFKFIPVLSEEAEDSDWDGPRGFVTQYFKDEYLDKGVVSADNIRAFFCGPPPMIDHGVEVLEKAGIPVAREPGEIGNIVEGLLK